MPAEYPSASFVASPNHSSRNRVSVNKVVIHITDGGPGLERCVERFCKPETKASPHFVIGRGGEVVQLVALDRAAWHALGWNSESVGIEHIARTPDELKNWSKLSRETRRKLVENEADADSATDPGLMPTEAQIVASAALVRWLCERLGLPMDRRHVVGHYESPTTTHEDCGRGDDEGGIWPWSRLLAFMPQKDMG